MFPADEATSVRPGQRVVIASGFSESKRVAQAISLGVHGLLQKPYSLHNIAKTVREALDAAEHSVSSLK